MSTTTGKRTAKVKLTLTKRTVENLQPADKPWIARDDRLIGFGVRVQPSGSKAFVVNYRTGSGGRRARNRRVAIGRCDRLAPEEARRLAQELLGRVARGDDPAQERAESRGMPTLREAFEEYGNGDAYRWVFPSPGGSSHRVELQRLYRRISRAAGTKFWFHGVRNVFITVAERELMLPPSLTKRLVNHARGSDVTESTAADWSVEQLRAPAQPIADRIDELARGVATDRVESGQPWPASGVPAAAGDMRFGIAH